MLVIILKKSSKPTDSPLIIFLKLLAVNFRHLDCQSPDYCAVTVGFFRLFFNLHEIKPLYQSHLCDISPYSRTCSKCEIVAAGTTEFFCKYKLVYVKPEWAQ